MSVTVRSYADAVAAPDISTRCKAHALAALSATAPPSVAVCVGLDRRLHASDVTELRGEPIGLAVARIADRDDPFVVARRRRPDRGVVALADLDDAMLPDWLAARGIIDRVDVGITVAGRLAAWVSLLRTKRRGRFEPHEIAALRRIRGTVELAYTAVAPARADGYARLRAAGLSEREAEVAELVASGATNAEVAVALSIGETTVKTYLARACARLGIRSRTELAGALARAITSAPAARATRPLRASAPPPPS